MSARRELARSVVRSNRREADRQKRDSQLAEVVTTSPLVIRLMDDGHLLDEDTVKLSQSVKLYDKDYGIDEGDNVMVHRVSGHWVATQVLSDKDV